MEHVTYKLRTLFSFYKDYILYLLQIQYKLIRTNLNEMLIKRKNIIQFVKTGEKYNNNDMLICKDNGDFMPKTTIRRYWNTLQKNLNLTKHYRIHDLRHYNAILMLQNGVSDKIARDRLGHTTVQMTDRYQHTTKALDKTNADKIKIF